MEAGGGGEAPGHAGGVVGEAEAAVGAEEDDAAVTAEAVIEVGDGFAGGDLRGGAGGDAVGGPLAEDELHDGFAPAGEGDGGGEIVGVAAASDEGGVADAAGSFVEGASGGGSGSEIAVAVEGDGADGVVRVVGGRRAAFGTGLRAVLVLEKSVGADGGFPPHRPGPVEGDPGFWAFVVFEAGEGVVSESGCLALLGEGQAGAFAIEDEFAVVDEGHAVGGGEALSAFSNEVDVG